MCKSKSATDDYSWITGKPEVNFPIADYPSRLERLATDATDQPAAVFSNDSTLASRSCATSTDS
jgi:hypothetical protein